MGEGLGVSHIEMIFHIHLVCNHLTKGVVIVRTKEDLNLTEPLGKPKFSLKQRSMSQF